MNVSSELLFSPQLPVPQRYWSSQRGLFGTKANTENECVDADVPSRPHGSECACECQCRFWGIFWGGLTVLPG